MIHVRKVATVLLLASVCSLALAQRLQVLDNAQVVVVGVTPACDLVVKRLYGEPGKRYTIKVWGLVVPLQYRHQARQVMMKLAGKKVFMRVQSIQPAVITACTVAAGTGNLPALPWTVIGEGWGLPSLDATPDLKLFLDRAKKTKRGMWANLPNP